MDETRSPPAKAKQTFAPGRRGTTSGGEVCAPFPFGRQLWGELP